MLGNQHVVDRSPWKSRSDLCSRAALTRQVLGAVNRDIHLRAEKRSLDFRREQAFSTRMEIDNFYVIAACHDDLGLDREVRMRPSNRLFNQQCLCTCQLTATCAEGDLANHRGNVMRDTWQGKLLASATVPMGGADFRRGKNVRQPARDDSALVRSNQKTQ